VNRIVVDASVVLKWYLVDEEYGKKALEILTQFVSGTVEILAPFLLEYELINGLSIAQKRGRLKQEELIKAIEGFFKLGIETKMLLPYYTKALEVTEKFNITVYDASYLALAEAEGIPFITGDTRLYNKVQKDLKWVLWIGHGDREG
jgi:predicted nucleic acid-binding protein